MEANGLAQLIHNWQVKADHDLAIIEQGLHAEPVVTDVLCFHCQQAVEKYLKLYLVAHHVDYPRTHNIAVLLEACKHIDETFGILDDVVYLTEYAVELRYPDDFYMPTQEELQQAYQHALRVKTFVLEHSQAVHSPSPETQQPTEVNHDESEA
jgi:HEPN domain-containing protein